MQPCTRRVFIGFVPFTALALSGCMKQAEGAEEINYSRESCTMCGMIISDPHFATEIRSAKDKALVKFGDFGCAAQWLKSAKWEDADIAEFWVMNSDDGTTWLDARKASFTSGAITPMDYGYAAVADARSGAVTFEEARKAVLSKGLSSRCLEPDVSKT